MASARGARKPLTAGARRQPCPASQWGAAIASRAAPRRRKPTRPGGPRVEAPSRAVGPSSASIAVTARSIAASRRTLALRGPNVGGRGPSIAPPRARDGHCRGVHRACSAMHRPRSADHRPASAVHGAASLTCRGANAMHRRRRATLRASGAKRQGFRRHHRDARTARGRHACARPAGQISPVVQDTGAAIQERRIRFAPTAQVRPISAATARASARRGRAASAAPRPSDAGYRAGTRRGRA